MSWTVSRSWQAPNIVSSATSVGNSLLISCGLEIMLLDEDLEQRWKKKLPFRVHAAHHDSGKIGLLYGHGFHLIKASDGSQLGDGRATQGGFSDILPRPGGGWVLSCRKGQLLSLIHI